MGRQRGVDDRRRARPGRRCSTSSGWPGTPDDGYEVIPPGGAHVAGVRVHGRSGDDVRGRAAGVPAGAGGLRRPGGVARPDRRPGLGAARCPGRRHEGGRAHLPRPRRAGGERHRGPRVAGCGPRRTGHHPAGAPRPAGQAPRHRRADLRRRARRRPGGVGRAGAQLRPGHDAAGRPGAPAGVLRVHRHHTRPVRAGSARRLSRRRQPADPRPGDRVGRGGEHGQAGLGIRRRLVPVPGHDGEQRARGAAVAAAGRPARAADRAGGRAAALRGVAGRIRRVRRLGHRGTADADRPVLPRHAPDHAARRAARRVPRPGPYPGRVPAGVGGGTGVHAGHAGGARPAGTPHRTAGHAERAGRRDVPSG